MNLQIGTAFICFALLNKRNIVLFTVLTFWSEPKTEFCKPSHL